jgi:conjugative relaxase-like TrwC/TraI family protein
VLSIGKLARGQASYYLQQARRRVDRPRSVASGIEDYYLAGSEAAGEWIGALTRAVELGGPVGERELRLVREGRSPESADLLTRRPRRVPGFDVTISAPRSVSVLVSMMGAAGFEPATSRV